MFISVIVVANALFGYCGNQATGSDHRKSHEADPSVLPSIGGRLPVSEAMLFCGYHHGGTAHPQRCADSRSQRMRDECTEGKISVEEYTLWMEDYFPNRKPKLDKNPS